MIAIINPLKTGAIFVKRLSIPARAWFSQFRSWILEVFSNIKIKYVQFIKRLTYSYRLFKWRQINRWRYFKILLQNNFGLIRRLAFIGSGVIAGLIIQAFGKGFITPEIFSNYLIATGAMIGGTIAIVFTISIFLIQSAADLYSSQFFEVYIHDWKEKFVYFLVIIITVVFFASGLYVGGFENIIPQAILSWFIVLSLALVGAVFALIDWQYKTVRQKINPTEAIKFLENQGTEFLKRVSKDAERLVGIIQSKDSAMDKNTALAVAYNQVLKPFVDNLDRQLENLVEISMKLADKQEVETSKRGFRAVHNILSEFFKIRQTSSLVIPSGIAFLAVESDSQSFLSRNFERINKAGERFIAENKIENATYIIDIYYSLALKTKDMSFVGRKGESPILENIVGYLNFFIDSGIRSKDIEIPFQGARALGKIALVAAELGLHHTLYGIQNTLLKIASFGMSNKQTVIIDICTEYYLKILEAAFKSNRLITRYALDSVKHMETIAKQVFALIHARYLPDDFASRITNSKPYDELYTCLIQILRHYSTLTDDRDKQRFRGDLIELLEELYRSLRDLSEEIKNCDSVLVDSIGRLLANINNLLIDLAEDQEFKDVQKELINRLGWNIHLPGWFANHADKFDAGSNPFYTLTDSIAKTGILAAHKLKNKKLVEDCIDSLYSLTKDALEKTTGSYGYDEPRILEKACYLGILAIKYGWNDIFTEIGFKIYEFEEKYRIKYLSKIPKEFIGKKIIGVPDKNQLYIELLRWRDEFDHERLNGNLRIRDDAEAMMYQLISLEDIDRFLFEMWRKLPADSPILEEIENDSKRRVLLKKLADILKKKVLS